MINGAPAVEAAAVPVPGPAAAVPVPGPAVGENDAPPPPQVSIIYAWTNLCILIIYLSIYLEFMIMLWQARLSKMSNIYISLGACCGCESG